MTHRNTSPLNQLGGMTQRNTSPLQQLGGMTHRNTSPLQQLGGTQRNTSPLHQLPHHKLIAYQVAVELLRAVQAANVRDKKLRDEATRAAKSTCLNCAEGAGRVTRADKARAFAIARGEAVEAIAAVEIAALSGDASAEDAARCVAVGSRVVALLTGLVR